VFKNHESCPEIMKTVKKFENYEIFTLPRNNEKPSKSLKNHEIFTLPRNLEKPSKSLKIMRFSHCPEIMKNRQSV
jgi:hypothetical protein